MQLTRAAWAYNSVNSDDCLDRLVTAYLRLRDLHLMQVCAGSMLVYAGICRSKAAVPIQLSQCAKLTMKVIKEMILEIR
jgi:hypothetical protein